MSLRWNFDEKVGEAVVRQGEHEFTLNLYEGNAFLIFLSEYKDEEGQNMYSLWSFFADEQHAKNCFGLSKGYESIFDDCNKLVKVRINKKRYRYTKKLVDMLAKAFDEIDIEIYSEDWEEKRNAEKERKECA